MKKCTLLPILISLIFQANCAKASDIKLPKPNINTPLMQIINTRASNRNLSDKHIALDILSDILWSAFGTNSHNTRTIPTGKNEQDLKVFVVYDKKVWLYDGVNNLLKAYSDVDLMPYLAKQDFVSKAPVHLIYAGGKDYAQTHSGSAYQNVYLYAAEKGLATVIRGYFDVNKIHQALKLPETEIVTYHQVIGYPQNNME